MRTIRQCLLLPICTLFIGSVWAQNDTTQSSDSLKTKSSNFERIIDALPRFSGYAQIGYTYQSNVGGVEGENSSSFNIKRLRLIAAGDISRHFDYTLQVEGFSTSKDDQNKALLSVIDIFMQAKIAPQLHIWAGQFPIPLGIETCDIGPAALEVPNYSLLGSKMAMRNAVSGVVSYARDMGVQLTGGLIEREGWSVINYNLGILNGSQMNQGDDNTAKDVIGRIIVKPIQNLQIATSILYGEYKNQALSTQYVPLTRCVASVWYKSPKFFVRSEFGQATAKRSGYITPNSELTARVDEQSLYAIAGYTFKGKYTPIVRYEYFDTRENTFAPNSVGRQDNILVGILWQPINKLHVQVDYTYSSYSKLPVGVEKQSGSHFEILVTGRF